MLYILDTDHVSLLQRGNQHVVARLSALDVNDRAVTIITVSEQIQGRLAVIRRAKIERDASRGFASLQATIAFYQAIQGLPYDENAQAHFRRLRQLRIHIGTQDLRIAATTLSHQAVLVTRNKRDFERIPELQMVDWSL